MTEPDCTCPPLRDLAVAGLLDQPVEPCPIHRLDNDVEPTPTAGTALNGTGITNAAAHAVGAPIQ